jgi:hypothetical protein
VNARKKRCQLDKDDDDDADVIRDQIDEIRDVEGPMRSSSTTKIFYDADTIKNFDKDIDVTKTAFAVQYLMVA